MLINNQTVQRCLVLSKNAQLVQILRQILGEMNFLTDFISDRKSALSYFLQYKHYLLLLDAEFLPRFPFRLAQLFRIAHRIPGVLIFNESERNLAGFSCLQNCTIEIVESPYTIKNITCSIDSLLKTMSTCIKNAYRRNIALQIGIALPLVFIVIYLVVFYFNN